MQFNKRNLDLDKVFVLTNYLGLSGISLYTHEHVDLCMNIWNSGKQLHSVYCVASYFPEDN